MRSPLEHARRAGVIFVIALGAACADGGAEPADGGDGSNSGDGGAGLSDVAAEAGRGAEGPDAAGAGFVVAPLRDGGGAGHAGPGSMTSPGGGGAAGDDDDDAGANSSTRDAANDAGTQEPDPPTLETLPYGGTIESYVEGDHAGFGQDDLPDVVLGPPMGRGPLSGSLDVLSLGVGGEIVLSFDYELVDGEGPDFIVFENPFWAGGDETAVFADLGEVSVSADGTTWHTFPCDTDGTGDGRYPGCAGWTPTERYDPLEVFPLDPELTGGDAFDLEELGLSRARFVRVRDLSTSGSDTTAGFDLDAIGLIHYAPLP